MGKLDGKIALVTGGTDGIGLGIAQGFINEGARVIICGRRQGQLDKSATSLGPNAKGIACDVSDMAQLDALYEQIKAGYGAIDVVVANAGMAVGAPFKDATEESFDAHFALNVKGSYFTLQKALPLLNTPASLIIIGSTSSSMGLHDVSVYAATKAAVRSFARNLSVELAPQGIRCNVLSPGFTKTPLLDVLMNEPEEKAKFDTWITQKVPMDRVASVEEQAKAAVFLASEDSSFTTGSELHVDGGMAQI